MADHAQLLDQLQRELNRVLEQTGHVFAAAARDSRASTLAHATKLRRDLPPSIDRFHCALDALQDEIQLAKTVMRRDLAVWREKSGTKQPLSPPKAAEMTTATTATPPIQSNAMEIDGIGPDAPQATTATNQTLPPDINTSRSSSADGSDDPAKSASSPGTSGAAHPASTVPPADSRPQALHIDTQRAHPNPPTSGENGPDDPALSTAALSTNADLESLFNDPASTGDGGGPPTGPATTRTPTPAAQFDHDDAIPPRNGGFDTDGGTGFDTATAGNAGGAAGNHNNHNDSEPVTVLPGLQDWANHAQPGEGERASDFVPGASAGGDFEDLFSVSGVGDASQHEREQQQQPVSSFDDLMDFDFGYASGNGDSSGVAGGGEGGSGEAGDFDFSFD